MIPAAMREGFATHRDIAVFVFTAVLSAFALGVGVGERTERARFAAAAECPAGPVERRTIYPAKGRVDCVYFWQRPADAGAKPITRAASGAARHATR